MALRVLTLQEKLTEIEVMIDSLRPGALDDERYHRLEVLKSLAADLRARMNGAPNIALVELERRMLAVRRSKTPLGYSQGSLVGAAEELICRWATVQQALETFTEKVEIKQ